MHSFFIVLAALCALAGHALALNITFGGETNITASTFFSFPPGPYTQPCGAAFCDVAVSAISECAADDNSCLCSADTSKKINDCEQCLFEYFIRTDTVPSDHKLGASTAVTAYATACKTDANITLALGLTLPSSWQGSQVLVLNTPVTVLAVGFGGILGMGLLYIMSNLS
ncbi:hypothetical protein BKA62DRAFT_698931 [Auriculariales sp. MPI-PUGE-AT-0066]|nr:hypothetical protein BKA62DRAFT_698931 [Auriculariales sp. MPI-PUGE-AT-0066]